jgi:hypothetical protein
MTVPKKIFLAFAVIFVLLLSYASFDIGSKTTFPGSKPQLKERLKKNFREGGKAVPDSIDFKDSIN